MSIYSPNNSSSTRPTVCRNCGSIIGGGEEQCAVCGAAVSPNTARTSRPAPDGETMRFARAILDRPHKFTIILIMANLFVFLLMWQSSGLTSEALWSFPEGVLIAYGAKLNSLINEHHQWWRFVTPMFVHVNLPHLLVNMYSLWMVGPYVEKLYGSTRFVVFWVLTGIAGVLASYLTVRPGVGFGPIVRFLFKSNDVPSAGASGALFGLVGVLFVFGIKFRHELPEGFKRAFGTGMLPIIFINLFIGYLGRGFIDNAAHLGGLVSGALLALAVNYRRPGEAPAVAIAWRVAQVLCIALVGVSFLMAYRNPSPPSALQLRAESADEQADKFVALVKAMNGAQEAFYTAVKDRDLTGIDSATKELDAAPRLDQTSDALRDRLKTLMSEARTLSSPVPGGGTPDPKKEQEKQNELTNSFVAWSREYNVWLKTTGRSLGGLVEMTEEPAK